jgi:tRNA G18 (ribose-2'-O)-methylase SpoU
MKAGGYTIVALEQSAESIPINQYKFPEKTVLVLG